MTLSNIKALSSQFWFFGLLVGAVGASLITTVITIWEVVENPGGVFHSAQGVNWSNICDTASSWFIPSFLYLAVIAALAHLSITAITKGFTK